MVQRIVKVLGCIGGLLLISFYVSGQQDSTRIYKHEVSVGFPFIPVNIQITEQNLLIKRVSLQSFPDIYFFCNITYRASIGKKSFLRFSAMKSVPSVNYIIQYGPKKASFFATIINTGYEILIRNTKKINMRVGGDIVLGYLEYHDSNLDYDNYYGGVLHPFVGETRGIFARVLTIGIGPVLTWQYNISNRFSLSSESGFFIYVSRVRDIHARYIKYQPPEIDDDTRVGIGSHRLLSLSLVYKFDI